MGWRWSRADGERREGPGYGNSRGDGSGRVARLACLGTRVMPLLRTAAVCSNGRVTVPRGLRSSIFEPRAIECRGVEHRESRIEHRALSIEGATESNDTSSVKIICYRRGARKDHPPAAVGASSKQTPQTSGSRARQCRCNLHPAPCNLQGANCKQQTALLPPDSVYHDASASVPSSHQQPRRRLESKQETPMS